MYFFKYVGGKKFLDFLYQKFNQNISQICFYLASLVAFLFTVNLSVYGHPAREVFDNKVIKFDFLKCKKQFNIFLFFITKESCEAVQAERLKLNYDLKLAEYVNNVARKRQQWVSVSFKKVGKKISNGIEFFVVAVCGKCRKYSN